MTEQVKKVRRELTGDVVSNKMEKTIVVEVTRITRHPKFKKVMRVHKRFHAHDEKKQATLGDKVRIGEIRPMSKLKRWELVEIIKH